MPHSTLLQLVARGRQDAYLTSNPQFTYFKHVYRRYTPFAIESIPIEFDGNADFGKRISVVIPRKAELLWSLFLEVDLPALPQPADPDADPNHWVNDIGHALIEDVSIEIGEKEIDKHTGEWLSLWGELTTPAGKRDGYNQMVGHINAYPPPTGFGNGAGVNLSIPLRFWFCNTIGAAIPLIALQAHPVRLIINLRPFQQLWWSGSLYSVPPGAPCPAIDPVAITRLQLFADYIFLEKEERQRFASVEHEYLIDQLQISPPQSIKARVPSTNVPLFFNHACKEFLWVVQQDRMRNYHEWFNYSSLLYQQVGLPADLMETALLRLDGYDRFYRRNFRFFRFTQPYQYHTNVPNNYIYLYSFSLRPEENQPSGSINCSKIDDITWNLTFNTAAFDEDRTISFFATNYNVLRIVGGLGGLAFIA
jgi:hypothetical protein